MNWRRATRVFVVGITVVTILIAAFIRHHDGSQMVAKTPTVIMAVSPPPGAPQP